MVVNLVIPRLNAAEPVVGESGSMLQRFRTFLLQVHRYLPIVGEGSPEGVVEAPQFSLYIDSTAGSGSIEYRKMLPDIGGDKKMGWVLV